MVWLSYDGNSNSPNTLAFVWMDRERRYFISSCSSLQQGKAWIRERWRQVNREDPNAEAEKVQLVVPQTKSGKLYYDTCASIDQHNRSRQQTLNLEKSYSVRHGTRESTYLSSQSVLLIRGRHIQMLHTQSQRNENSTYASQRSLSTIHMVGYLFGISGQSWVCQRTMMTHMLVCLQVMVRFLQVLESI